MEEEHVRPMNDPEFDAMMKKLAEEAQSTPAVPPPSTGGRAAGGDADRLRAAIEPLETGLQVIARRCDLIIETAGRLEKALAPLASLPSAIEAVRRSVERPGGDTQEGMKSLIDALHQEMRGYKDAFLLETILKPVLRDLISLYDDLEGIHHRLTAIVEAIGAEPTLSGEHRAALVQERINLSHAIDYLVEILERREVNRLPQSTGAADKTGVKVVRVVRTTDPELDGRIEASLRRGFSWRGGALRPEEVSIWRAD